ncbi:MAG TPA: hypothetical protein PKA63_11800 [Oligoflexia bacterium]|nr:hypothetical protein [Oligoflexia bacterium]HMP49337.1 hypothetical protein [Oligoflexia bacterium]
MKSTIFQRTLSRVGLIGFSSAVLLLGYAACGGRGDTANSGDPNVNLGNPIVSNGGSGSTMTIELEGGGNEIGVARQVHFKVTALDPSGLPLVNIRLFCESEKGLAIIDPSSGGTAFAHTNSNGIMSGILGGVTPGSFLLECRAPVGFNLVARKSFRITGTIPEGFDGFPGAAGGNLGGGVLVDPPRGEDVALVEVLFSSVTNTTPSRVADIDLVQDQCNPAFPNDPAALPVAEVFGPDNFHITITNNLDQRISVTAVDIQAPSSLPNGSIGQVVSVEQQLGGLVILPNSQIEFTGPFTNAFFSGGFTSEKRYAGSSSHVPFGTFNVTFTVTFTTANGQRLRGTQNATIRALNFDNCGN